MSSSTYSVLLYYHYTPLGDAALFCARQHRLCYDLGLRGRVLVASEGINGTLSGRTADCQAYIDALAADARFADMEMKMMPCSNHVFSRLHVRLKDEIVRANLPDMMPRSTSDTYVTSEVFRSWLLADEQDLMLLDARSDYEHELGRFKGAHCFPIRYFRSFFDQVARLRPYRDKKIVTYCTGGVRCEKVTQYLRERGFSRVYQLKGGILRYAMETDGAGFEGMCYVFDERMKVPVNRKSASLISHCVRCRAPSARILNCANEVCNKQCVLCENCAQTYQGTCSEACLSHEKRRPYNGTGYYRRASHGYDAAHAFRSSLQRRLRHTQSQ